MNDLFCHTCGSHNIGYNKNVGEWGWPYRCFTCDPPTDKDDPSALQFKLPEKVEKVSIWKKLWRMIP